MTRDDLATVRTTRDADPTPFGLRLEVMKGPDAGLQLACAARACVVGRAATADLQLTDNTVSAFHVEVSVEAGGIRVVDLESANGTVYAGARLERARIPSGAMLNLGRTVVRVDVDAPFDPAIHELPTFGELRGGGPRMRELFAALARVARTDLSVLIEGPTGAGKELVARALHSEGRVPSGPFVVLDCTAIPASLAESTLFGHEKGAFTGATERREGVFEAAEGGTVFLDEIGELPLDLQPKLLRVLERREVVRVGGTRATPVRVRLVSATLRDLRAMINQGRFREDLYYRLAGARVALPALGARREDVPLLVRHFLAKLPVDLPGARAIEAEALEELARRDYPGNVRELRATVERAATTAAGEVITLADLAFERVLAGHHVPHAPAARASLAPDAPLPPFKDAKRTLVDEFERDYLVRLVARTDGNLSRAAALARIERHHLRDLLRRHGLRDDD